MASQLGAKVLRQHLVQDTNNWHPNPLDHKPPGVIPPLHPPSPSRTYIPLLNPPPHLKLTPLKTGAQISSAGDESSSESSRAKQEHASKGCLSYQRTNRMHQAVAVALSELSSDDDQLCSNV